MIQIQLLYLTQSIGFLRIVWKDLIVILNLNFLNPRANPDSAQELSNDKHIMVQLDQEDVNTHV